MNVPTLACKSRPTLVATAIAAAFVIMAAGRDAGAVDRARDSAHEAASSRISTRHPVAMPHVVTSCSDDFATPGTLRWTLADANTLSGDIIDLSQLTCSHISLGSELKIHQDDLSLIGPDQASGYSLTLDAYLQSEIIQHFGYGTLELANLDIIQGYFESSSDPTGGCIWSRGSISAIDSAVAHCGAKALSAAVPALGGGIYARGGLSLTRSTISYSSAVSNVAGGTAAGGGAFVMGIFKSTASTLSHNSSRTINGPGGKGGGAFARYGAVIDTTTIADNVAEYAGGVMLYAGGPSATATITNSTVSGNVALRKSGGIYSNTPLQVANSTIAFNSSRSPASSGAGLFAVASLDLVSTIVADNWSNAGLSDLETTPGVTISGSHNLVVQAGTNAVTPPDTIDDCPRLDVLTNSGGETATHRVREGSGALERGAPGGSPMDQRGLPRIVGTAADVGSVERQDVEVEERLMSSGFEGHCDV